MTIREKLIAAGVKNLKEFGYPAVNAENILTDEIYSAFFAQMLPYNRGHGVDAELDALLQEIKANEPPAPTRKKAKAKKR